MYTTQEIKQTHEDMNNTLMLSPLDFYGYKGKGVIFYFFLEVTLSTLIF